MRPPSGNKVSSREGADKQPLAGLPLESQTHFPALRLAFIYAFFGALWIFLSDRLVDYLVTNLELAQRLHTYKGWFFIAVTSMLLWLLARRFLSQVRGAEEALANSNRKLRAISNCNQILLWATDEQSLLQEVCRIIREDAGHLMAWVAYAEHDEARTVRPVAWSGAEEEYLTNLGITWADTERGQGPSGTAIRSGKTCCIQDFATDPRLAPWRESILEHGFLSCIALPLKDDHDNTFGSLSIYSSEPKAFTPEEIRLLEELAGNLAFGIITLRSRAAREQAEQEVTLLSFALNTVREAALLMDDTARFRYVNDESCRILGYSRQELLGMSVADIDPDFPLDRWPDHWRNLKTKRSLSFESRHRTRAGRIFPVEISANYFEYGGRAYNLALVRDITERKRAEEALKQSEAYLAEAQRLSHTGSWAFDVAGDRYIYVSEECFRIFGFGEQESLPDREAVSRMIDFEDWEDVDSKFEKSLREKVDTLSEFRITLPDGTVRHIQAIRHPVLNETGDVVKLVGTVIDITEQKRAGHEREKLRQLEADLAHINRVSIMGELSASIAHEVNQPLSGVVSYGGACLRWLAAVPPNMEEAREAVRRIISAAKHAAEVITRVRALTRRAALSLEKVDLNEIIREVLALGSDEAKRNRVKIQMQFADDLSPVSGDRVQLQQVVLNLVMNGIESMRDVADREREMVVTTRNLDPDQVQVTVKDSGIGLGPNMTEKIFESFYTTKASGMGMGLSISRSILQAHEGRLWAIRNDGPGATVQFTLPKYRQKESHAGF